MPGDGRKRMIYINAHEVVCDNQERLEAWTSYDNVVRLAMNFIKNCPVDAANGLPWYLQYSCFWTDPLRPTIWPDNPAGKFAWATTTLLKYYPYSGDASFILIVKTMMDRLWEYRTPENNDWPGVPYASAQPGTGIYYGARADGEYATEPDKVAQAGRAYVDLYEVTGEKKSLEMGSHCAAVLASKVRLGDEDHSPWPFRVDVRSGVPIEEYTAHMIPAIRLFDELSRLGVANYRPLRDQVWNWIEKYPLKNNIWKGHFEDIRIDSTNQNRDQLSPLETARYILYNQDQFPDWMVDAKGLIDWVKDNLGAAPFFGSIPIHEQKFCYFPMGSHTARFASLSALFAEQTGTELYKEQALRSFNWASYMAVEDGTVTTGIDRPDYYNQCWFTDGYFDYVPHFIEGMASMPELAPADQDHMLRSTSVIQEISYLPKKIFFRAFDTEGVQKLRLTFTPLKISAEGKRLKRNKSLDVSQGWTFDPVLNILNIKAGAHEVEIQG